MNDFVQGADFTALDVEALSIRLVSQIATLLNECLGILDQLGLSQAATHLSIAIESLPGQTALPPMEHMELLD